MSVIVPLDEEVYPSWAQDTFEEIFCPSSFEPNQRTGLLGCTNNASSFPQLYNLDFTHTTSEQAAEYIYQGLLDAETHSE
ncbi:hypothetical protein RhiJN_11676 [Ceratobasidium sp. AG-Ba]|nr:hypothetical protein RhiJN_11676 [Ceratobasidium sp. AG-Ba]